MRSALASMISGGAAEPPVTSISTVSEAVLPSASVTVTVAVCVPAPVNVRVTVWPNAVPSSNSHV